MCAVHIPFCASSGATRAWLDQFHSSEGKLVPGHMGLCAGLAGPHSDFLELQATGPMVGSWRREMPLSERLWNSKLHQAASLDASL